jgi:hypothetical protein
LVDSEIFWEVHKIFWIRTQFFRMSEKIFRPLAPFFSTVALFWEGHIIFWNKDWFSDVHKIFCYSAQFFGQPHNFWVCTKAFRPHGSIFLCDDQCCVLYRNILLVSRKFSETHKLFCAATKKLLNSPQKCAEIQKIMCASENCVKLQNHFCVSENKASQKLSAYLANSLLLPENSGFR